MGTAARMTRVRAAEKWKTNRVDVSLLATKEYHLFNPVIRSSIRHARKKERRQNLPQCGVGWPIFREDLAGNQLQSSVPRHCDITPTHHPSTPQHCFLFPSQNQILAGRHDISYLFQVSFRVSVSAFLSEIESNVTNCWYPSGAISLVNQNLDS